MRACRLFRVAAAVVAAHAASGATPVFFDRFDYRFAPWSVGDVNGDGIPDIVEMVNSTGFGVNVSLGNGDGTFRAGVTTVTNFFGFSQLADVNGDGKLDLVTAGSPQSNGIKSSIGINLGNGDGTFASTVVYPDISNENLFTLAVADFNHDGIPDLVAGGETGVWVSLVAPDGSFGHGASYPVNGQPGYTGIVLVADLNHDGRLDLVDMTNTGFAILIGNGDGTFSEPSYTSSTYNEAPSSISAADLNGDGFPDVVLAEVNRNYVLVYLGRGDGTFNTPTYANLPTNLSLAIGDVNGDGFPDLVSSGVYVAFGDGKGHFRAPVYYPVAGGGSGGGGTTQDVFLSDLRKNGRFDIIAVGLLGSTSVLLNIGKGVFNDGISIPVAGGQPGCIAAADFNGDNHLDVAVTASQGISVMLGTGIAKTLFAQGPSTSIPYLVTCPIAADVNGDGIPDLVLVTTPPSTTGELTAYLGRGDGTFSPAAAVALSGVGQIALGDFNGDGKQDVVTTNNQLALGNGDGTFRAPKAFVPYILAATQATGFSDITAGDLNGDGKPDVVLTDGIHSYLYVLINNGKGGWIESVYGVCGEGYIPVIGDVSGDNLPDIVVGNSLGGGCVYLNLGGGKFAYKETLSVAIVSEGSVPLIADMNGDGVADILLMEGSDVAVLLGQGSGHFATPFYLGSDGGGIVTGNFHGQSPLAGTPDIVVPSVGTMGVILNLTQ